MGLQQCYKKPPLCGMSILDVSADILDQHLQDAHRLVIPTISLFWDENGSLLLIKRHIFRRFAQCLVLVHYKAIMDFFSERSQSPFFTYRFVLVSVSGIKAVVKREHKGGSKRGNIKAVVNVNLGKRIQSRGARRPNEPCR